MTLKRISANRYINHKNLVAIGFLGCLLLLAVIGTVTASFVGKDLAVPLSIVIMASLLGGLMFWSGNSPEAKAKDALKKGLIQEALGYYDQAGLFDEQVYCLKRVLPKATLSNRIIEAASELGNLKAGLLNANRRNPGNPAIENLMNDAFKASNLIWELADRVSRLHPADLETRKLLQLPKLPFFGDIKSNQSQSPLHKIIEDHIQKVETLTVATRQSREALTIIMLSNVANSGEVANTEKRLTSLSQAVIELYNADRTLL